MRNLLSNTITKISKRLETTSQKTAVPPRTDITSYVVASSVR